jgi:cytochrome b subunit of formate dehydrogenase
MLSEEHPLIERCAWVIFAILCILSLLSGIVFFIYLELFWLALAILLALSAVLLKSYTGISFSDHKHRS